MTSPGRVPVPIAMDNGKLKMKSIIIFGTSDIAELAAYYFHADAGRNVAGFAVDAAFVRGSQFAGRPVVPFESVETVFPPTEHDFFVAVSYAQLNALRMEKMKQAEAKGYHLASYLSSRAYVWDRFVVEPNVFILEDNTLQPFCRVGRGVTLWSGNHIGHHSRIGDYGFVTSHVVISGGVEIGDRSFIGVNATIRDHVKIGTRCVIGAGSLILQDAADESVFGALATERSRVPSSRLRKL